MENQKKKIAPQYAIDSLGVKGINLLKENKQAELLVVIMKRFEIDIEEAGCLVGIYVARKDILEKKKQIAKIRRHLQVEEMNLANLELELRNCEKRYLEIQK